MFSIREPTYSSRNTPVISTVTHPTLRAALKQRLSQTELAIEAVNTQLKIWEETLEKEASSIVSFEILGFDISQLQFEGYLGQHVEADVQVIQKGVQVMKSDELLNKGVWSWSKLPYTVRCVGSSLPQEGGSISTNSRKKKAKVIGNDDFVDDLDEWVLQNEVFLRSLSRHCSEATSALTSWSVGLVRIDDLAKCLFRSSEVTSRRGSTVYALKIPRTPIETLPGYTVLAEKRDPMTFVQASSSDFKRRFDNMTGGLLAGLDWNNVFIAGGLVLGVLLTPDIPSTASLPSEERFHLKQASDWISSDIDLYIYGLDVPKANAKISHIAQVYQNNLGSANAPFLVVRNSQTITLYSEWPKRRVQIVLKLVKSPREVLLNFDLDICAVGWDGKEVWMLPRFVRALETGTNVFTMDLVNGHYLGDRKATRDKRVIKYAKRGYGIRIIPLYIGFLSPYQSQAKSKTSTITASIANLSLGATLQGPPLSLPKIAQSSREWTRKVVDRYIECGQSELQPDGRQWPKLEPRKEGKPVFSYAMLESYYQITTEPLRRSCLTGFSLFMRHVGLWELEQEGKIEIYEHVFAEDAYDHFGEVAYDDTPGYEWDEKFSISNFTAAIDIFNEQERQNVVDNWCWYGDDDRLDLHQAKRVTYGTSMDTVLFSSSNDITIPIVTSTEFVEFANEVVAKALSQKELPSKMPLEILTTPSKGEGEGEELVVALWRLDKILNWQMVDRRIDEIREVIWAFHRANERLSPEPESRLDNFRTNVSRRAIRTSENDEGNSFVRWVARMPYERSTKLNGIYVLAEKMGREVGSDDDDDDDL